MQKDLILRDKVNPISQINITNGNRIGKITPTIVIKKDLTY